MRNYIKTRVGTVIYRLSSPPDQPPITQHFIQEDELGLVNQMAEFVQLLDPSFFEVLQGPYDYGPVYWLLNKDNVFEIINGVPAWWTFIGTNIATVDNPRKSWSHGH